VQGALRLCFVRPRGPKKSWEFRKFFSHFTFVLTVLKK
jgi:hypothetical protein